jgi:hypothetical protein
MLYFKTVDITNCRANIYSYVHCSTKLGIKLELTDLGGETNEFVIFVFFFVRLTSLSLTESFSVEWLDDGKKGI